MNTINVTVELGPESMAKLDKILEALQGQHHNCAGCVEAAVSMTKDLAEAAAAAADAPKPEFEEEPPAPLNPDVIMPARDPEPAAAPEPEVPKYTKQDVVALVQKLAAPNSSKREQAKAIVKSYGTKVSDIPEDKYGEVMDKLTKLDKEG